MSVFSRLKSAKSTAGRDPWISRGGVTIEEVLRVNSGETREGVPYFGVSLKVVEVIAETPLSQKVLAYNEKASADKKIREGAHQPGETVRFNVNLAPPQLDSKLGNVKNFVEFVCDSLDIDNEDWTEEQWEAVCMGVGDGKGKEEKEMRAWLLGTVGDEQGIAAGDGTLLAGLRVIRSATVNIGITSGKPYIINTFQPAPEDDVDEETDDAA